MRAFAVAILILDAGFTQLEQCHTFTWVSLNERNCVRTVSERLSDQAFKRSMITVREHTHNTLYNLSDRTLNEPTLHQHDPESFNKITTAPNFISWL